MKHVKLLKVVCVFMGLLLLSACGHKTSETVTSSSKDEKTVKLTIGTMPAPDSLPLYVAKQEGYFKEEGLDVKLTNFKSPKERDAAIAGGQLNAAVTDVVALASYVNGDLGWRSATSLTGYFGIVTSDPAVKNISDLKGKSVATLPRQTPTFYLDQQLKDNGLSPKDVTIKEVAAIPARLQLVEQKQADVTILPDPFLSMAKQAGLKEIAQSDPAKYKTTILGVDKKLADDKKTLAKLTTAYNKAVNKINANKASAYQTILTKDLGFPEKIAKNYQLPHYEKAGRVPKNELQEAFNYAKENGVLKEHTSAAHYQLPVAK